MKITEAKHEIAHRKMRLSNREFDAVKTNGTKVNYYIVCPRKLWLFSHDLQMESTSDKVALGKFLHERSYRRLKKRDVLVDNLIRVDLIESSGRVLEVKFSRKMTEASRMQLLYYLYYIKRRFGVELVGELRFPKERRRMEVCLTAEDVPVIERILKAIREIESMPAPPHAEFTPICTVCAYAELCWG